MAFVGGDCHFQEQIVTKRKNSYECSHCNKVFSHSSSLTNHLRTHTGDKPFHCSHCGRAFAQKNNLTNHIKIHTGLKTYQCIHCKKAFTQRNSLTAHLKVHTGEKPFKCSYCDQTFKQFVFLLQHLKTHKGKTSDQCKYRNKPITEMGTHTTHMVKHNEDKTYQSWQCNQCDKVFSNNDEYRLHLQIHAHNTNHTGTANKLYKCNHCDSAFSHDINLMIHLQKAHADIGIQTRTQQTHQTQNQFNHQNTSYSRESNYEEKRVLITSERSHIEHLSEIKVGAKEVEINSIKSEMISPTWPTIYLNEQKNKIKEEILDDTDIL